MACQYQVDLERRDGGKVECETLYVSASDDKVGYKKARRKAEAKLLKQGRVGFRAVLARAVG